MQFNEKLIMRRKEFRMTQDELAEKLDISRQSISRWENGECLPEADKLIRLADILDIGLDELTGREVKIESGISGGEDMPKKKRAWLPRVLTAGVCAALAAACFLAGRYLAPYNKDDAKLRQDYGIITYFNEDGDVLATESAQPVVYPNDDYYSPLDKAMTVAEMYDYLIENEPGISEEDAARLAEELADRIEQIEKSLMNGDTDSLQYYYTEDGAMVIDIGKLVDGVLSDPGN